MRPVSLLLVAVCALALAASCFAAPQGYVRLETLDNPVPFAWTNVGRASAHKLIKLQVAIKQSNVDQLLLALEQVSTPTSSKYGQYWTTEQIGQLVAPPADRLARLNAWLTAAGISASQCVLSLHRDFLIVSLTISQAEALLKTEFYDFSHASGKTLSRALLYHVPSTLASDVDFIGGVIRFPANKESGVHGMLSRNLASSTTSQPLPPGDSPLQGYILIGDKEFTVNFAPRCANGKTLSAGSLQCPEGQLTSASVEWGHDKSERFSLAVGTTVAEGFSRCSPVLAWHGVVHSAQLEVLAKYGLGTLTMFCSVKVSKDIANFRAITNAVLITTAGGVDSSALTLPVLTPAPWVTPRRLQELYRIPPFLKNSEPSNAQSVSEFLGQYYSPTDLSKFMSLMGLPDYKVDKLIGPNVASQPGLEASLDIQYMLGISNNVSTWFWSLGQLHEGQEPFLQWLIDVSNTQKVPWVHSTSYADEEQSLTLEYMTRVNTELVKAGVRGLTLLFSSGDDGVGGYTLRTNTTICEKRGFAPEFPSSSPYVTAVGGTQFSDQYLPICSHEVSSLTYACEGEGEIVSSSSTGSRITSGGGFSINWPRPSYQKDAVDQYLQYTDSHGLTPPQSLWNRNGRGLPDISGMAHNYLTLIGGDVMPVDGTSASTPLTAAMLTLINDRLISIGKPTLGFFNPLLYQLGKRSPQVFTDIVVGDNACSAFRDICCNYGFEATPGWDATTGFGSINFDALYMVIGGANPWEVKRAS